MEKGINEKEFTDGFNRGYWLFNFEPAVAKSLIKSKVVQRDDFSIGFAEGLKQAEQEKTLNGFEQLRNENKDQELGFER